MGDPIRAQFDATQSDPNSSSAYFRLHEQLDKEESLPPHWGKFCGRYLYDILGDKDSDVYYDDDCGQSRMGIEILPCIVASLDGCCQGAPYVNNPELTGLKLHLNPVSGRATSDGWLKQATLSSTGKTPSLHSSRRSICAKSSGQERAPDSPTAYCRKAHRKDQAHPQLEWIPQSQACIHQNLHEQEPSKPWKSTQSCIPLPSLQSPPRAMSKRDHDVVGSLF
jgi:hypothetical protein